MFKKLYKYQETAVKKLLPLLRTKRRVLAVAPTGSGKTVVGVATLLAMGKQTRVLWIAHRKELLSQASDQMEEQVAKLLSTGGVRRAEVGFLSGDRQEHLDARVLVASIGSIVNRLSELGPFDLIVVDEAHRNEAASYKKVHCAFPDAKILGLTATPQRLDGKALEDSFDAMYEIATQSQLLREKRIAKVLTYGFPVEQLKTHLKGLPQGQGDFARAALGRAMGHKLLLGNVVKEYLKRGQGEPAICFAASREHARKLVARFKKEKLRVGYVDGMTPADERDATIASFRANGLDVLVNVDVLTEGFDCDAKCIIDASPTKSVTRYLQRIGRGVRIFKGKPVRDCIYLDHAGNFDRHDEPQKDRLWSLKGSEENGKTTTRAMETSKVCLACGRKSTVLNLTTKCPICGEMYSDVARRLQEVRNIELRLRDKAAEEAAFIRAAKAALISGKP